jgi:broad specificity phosphatase PhoE
VLCCQQELEQQHQGQHILLVSHGDTLSILQATFHGTPLTHHRQYGLATAELKCLNPEGALQQNPPSGSLPQHSPSDRSSVEQVAAAAGVL